MFSPLSSLNSTRIFNNIYARKVQQILVAGLLMLSNLSTAQINDKNATEIRIDPTAVLDGENASDIFSRIEFLPLETTKLSAFQDISQLEVTKEYFIIWDKTTNSILFFDRNGKYKNKISNTDKQLDTPYRRIDRFNVDEASDELFFYDPYTNFIYYYNLNARFVKKERPPKTWGLHYLKRPKFKAYLTNYNPAYGNDLKEKVHNLNLEYSTGKKRHFFPFDTSAVDPPQDITSAAQGFFDNQDGTINFSSPFNYNIYTIDPQGQVECSFKFILPAVNTVPDDFLTDSTYSGKRRSYLKERPEVAYGVSDFYKAGNNIVFSLLKRGIHQTIVYNLNSAEAKTLNGIIPDNISQKLPFIGRRLFAIDDNSRIVSYVDAPSLFLFQNNLVREKNWDHTLPPKLKAFFSATPQQNPVLTLLTIK